MSSIVNQRSQNMTRFIVSLLFLASVITPLCSQQYSGYGITFQPNFSHRRLVNFDISMQAQVDSLEANEIARPSYAAGLVLSYRGQKAGIQVGLNYSQLGYRGKRKEIPFNNPQSINFDEQQYQFRSQIIEVPFLLQFYQTLTAKDDFFFALGSGLSYNFSNQNIITYYNGESSSREVSKIENEDYRRVNYCFQTAMGWEHKFGENFVMSIAPTFKLWMAGVQRDVLLNRNLYQMGLRMTFRFDREIEVY
jgi:hypothetical protein